MSEDEGENGHNKKQKMKFTVQEEAEYKPFLQELSSPVNTNFMILRLPIERVSASPSTNPFPLQPKYIQQGGAIPSSSVAVQVNQNMPQRSNVARRKKKVATRKYKGIVIQEERVLPKRKRPANLKLAVPIPKGVVADSENDLSSDEYTDESDKDYIP